MPVIKSGDPFLERKQSSSKPNSILKKKDPSQEVKTLPIDLRAETNEPTDPINSQPLQMDYLLTQVVTKANETRWLPRLFVLTDETIACYYETAPHLQGEGKNILTKVCLPIREAV